MNPIIEEYDRREKEASEYCMKIGALLGVIFIVQYMVTIMATSNILYSILVLAMSICTPLFLGYSSYHLRKTSYNLYFRWTKCWMCGLKVMFFASLIEACFIVIYNEWVNPDNLFEMRQNTIALMNQARQLLAGYGNAARESVAQITQTIEQLEASPIPTPIESAIGQLTTNLFWSAIWMIPFSFIFYRKSKHESKQ